MDRMNGKRNRMWKRVVRRMAAGLLAALLCLPLAGCSKIGRASCRERV